MAIVRNKEVILDKMGKDGISNWTVFDSDKKTIIDEADGEDLDIAESIDKLSSLLDNLDGMIHVVLRTTSKKVRGAGGNVHGTYQYTLRLGSAVSGVSGHMGALGGGSIAQLLEVMALKHQAEMQALRNEFLFNNKINELERKLKDKTNDDGVSDYLKYIMNVIEKGNQPVKQPIQTVPVNKPMALAGTDEPTEEAQELKKQKLTESLQRLLKADPDFINVLEKIADLAENNPTKYNMAKSML